MKQHLRTLLLVLTTVTVAARSSQAAEADSYADQIAAMGGDAFQAVVTKVFRQVEWQRFQTRIWQHAAINNVLVTGDTIRTGADAKAELLYGDGSVTRVGSLTSLTLQGSDQRTLHLNGGRVWLHIIKHNAGMKVITPGAVAAVTGTELMVAFDPVQHTTEVTVFEGSVNVTGDVGNLVQVRGGTTTLVPMHAPAMAPVPLDNGKVQERENIFKPLSVQEDVQGTPKPVPVANPTAMVNNTPAPVISAAPPTVQPTPDPVVPKPVQPDLKSQTAPLLDPRVLNGSPTTGKVKVIVQ